MYDQYSIDMYDIFVMWMQLRVDLTGQSTQKAFDTIVRSLAKNAPPVPGFRKAKGGDFLHDFPNPFQVLVDRYYLA